MSHSTHNEGERLVKFKHLVAYGSGDIYGGGAFLVVGMLFLFYLTEVVGLSPLLAGLVFGIGKVWDAISDPMMGYISDRTKSKYGRRRVYFLIGIIPITLTFIIMWVPVSLNSQFALFLYYSFAYILFATVFTMVMVPYSALAAELSGDYKVRNRLSGSRLFFSGFSSLLAATVPKIIIDSYTSPPSRGYFIMSVIFGIFFALPWVITYVGTWETSVSSAPSVSSNFLKDFLTIFRNKSFRIHIIMYVAAYSAMDMLMALFNYYLTYSLKRPEIYSIAMGTLMVVQLAMIPVYVRIANVKGKRFAFRMGLLIWIVGMGGTLLLSKTTPVLVVALVCAVIGLGTASAVYIPYAILPNVIDVDELMTGSQRSGVYSGAMTLTRKLIQGALVMPLIGIFLQMVGFVSNSVQSQQVITRFFIFFIGGPLILIIAGIIAATWFELSPKNSVILSHELKRLRDGGKKEHVNEEVKIVCEKLTGIPYDTCWPV
jgi:oligogalacturonide transporter